jgi:hypothetical protein
MLSKSIFKCIGALSLSALLSSPLLFGAGKETPTYQVSKGTVTVSPTTTSPAAINAVPHPISTNKPMRKYHKPPMVPPADKLALIVKEQYDPNNPRHVVDRATTADLKAIMSSEPCRSYVGINNTGWNPPDPHVAVGPNHLVAVVNSSIGIYDKNTGQQLLQSTGAYWFRNTVPAPAGGFIYDPKVVYDPNPGRFIMLYLCQDDISKAEYLVSVSETSDAMGNWYSYNFDATLNGAIPTDNWADYPGLGFDYNDAVYVTTNQWQFGGGYQYPKIRILPKSQLYYGEAVTFSDIWNIRYQDNSIAFTIKPATTYSNANGEFLVSNIWYGANYTTYWKINDPLGNDLGPILVRKPQVSLQSSYPATPPVLQQGGAAVGTLSAMTQDVTYRNGKVYTAFDQSFNWGSGEVAAVRILGIDTASSLAVIDKIFGADQKYYFFPGIYVDPANRIYVACNRSANNEYIGLYYVEDFMETPTSRVLKLGEGPHSGGDPVRWGDYAGITPDGVDQNKVWIFSEFSPSSQSSWKTWIGQVPSRIGKPLIAAPANGDLVTVPVQLTWDLSSPAASYRVQVADDSMFASTIVDTIISSNYFVAAGLPDRLTLYWRVQGMSGCEGNPWSDVRAFKTCNYVSGDADRNGFVNISDAIYLINYVFSGGPAPNPLASADANCDGLANISDAVYIVAFIFSGGPAPCNPC